MSTGDLLGVGALLNNVLKRNKAEENTQVISKKTDQKEVGLRGLARSKLFTFLILAVPIGLSAVYFFGIARHRYIVRSDFVIRKADDQSSGTTAGIASLLGGSDQSSIEDARFLDLYLESPQVLTDLKKTFDFNKAYARKGDDPFAGLPPSPSIEEQNRFFKRQVVVQLQDNTGIISLGTVGLDPETAYKLNKYLLSRADEFVNKLNQEINRQQLTFASQQVKVAEQRLQQAVTKLQQYQDKNEIIDPTIETASSSAGVAALEQELAKLKVQSAVLKRQFKDQNAPEVQIVEDQVKEMDKQVRAERLKIVSPSGRDLSRKIAEVERLKSTVQFSTELYRAALTASEQTRLDSLRKQKFMAILSAPQLPEETWDSWKYLGFFTVSGVLLVGYALTMFAMGMADSHRE